MKKLRGAWILSFCILALNGCSLITLPFQIIGALFKAIIGLFNAILSVGSKAAASAVKLSPYALFFSGEPHLPTHEAELLACSETTSIESMTDAIEAAGLKQYNVQEALDLAPSTARFALIIDPADLLIPERRKEIVSLVGDEAVSQAVWINGADLSAPLKIALR